MNKFIVLCLTLFLIMIAGASAALTITEGTLDLGSAGVGTTASGTFNLANSDTADVTITFNDIPFTGTAGSFIGTTGTSTPTTISASSSATVNLKVVIPTIQAVGTYSGTLDVVDAGDNTNNASLPVTITVSNTHDVTVEGGEIIIDLDYGTLRDNDDNITVSKDFTVKNNGAFAETATLSLVNINTGVKNAALTTTTFPLAKGEPKSITFSAALPVKFDSGVSPLPSFGKLRVSFNSNTQTKDFEMRAKVKPMLEITKLEVEVGDERDSSVDDGEKISKDASRGDKIVMTFEVKNLFHKDYDEGDIEDVEINVQIDESDEDDFGESIDEDSDSVDVDAGDREKDITVEFDVPDDAEDGTYTFLITATGEDGNGAEHTVTMTADLEVNIQKDDVRISRIDVIPNTVECNRDVSVNVFVRNHGSRDQDDARLQIDNSALGIDQDFEFGLDESGDRDDDARRQFSFTVGDSVAAGIYPIEVRVFIEGDDLQDDDHVNLNVKDCSTSTGSTVIVQPPAAAGGDTADNGTDADTTLTGGVVTDIVFDTDEKPFTESVAFWIILALANLVVLAVIIFLLMKVFSK